MMIIAKIGFFIFVLSLMAAVYTANLFTSAKEKSLAEKYIIQKQSNSPIDDETKYAYIGVLIAKITRIFMAVGVLLFIIGCFFN